ncbi:MAG: Gfo/Idh/MocA family oxidoreductase [Anaerolineae bacterium]|nr:Gfo/Idh/MocA family oxidoreductase [Anaerolineae bacterium]
MSSKYRVGIIGCGRIAPAHVNSFRAVEGYELAALADVKREAGEGLCSKFELSVPLYEDYREMLEKEHLDVVTVATWPGTHAEITVAAAKAGVAGILCEKPMAPSLGEAAAMLEACDEYGAKLAIGHQHRFDPAWNRAKELIADGAIGQPLLALCRVTDGLLNNGTHYIDGIRYILGDPLPQWAMGQLERRTDRYERGEPIEDRLLGLVAFSGGAQALVEVDMPTAAEAASWPYTFLGTEGRIQLEPQRLTLINASGKQQLALTAEVSSHVLQAREFLRWLDGEIKDYRGSGEKAYQTVAIMMGMYESVRRQGVVSFPLTVKESPLKLMLEAGRLPVEQVGRYDIRA